jgi:hypothetical protein
VPASQFPKIPENRSTSDKEVLTAVRYAALAMAKWKRLATFSEERAHHHRESTAIIREELQRVLVDNEKTPMFAPEEFAFIFLGVTMLTLYEDIFPELLNKALKDFDGDKK